MTLYVKVSGSWRTVATVYTKSSGAWKNVPNVYSKVSGAWRTSFDPKLPTPVMQTRVGLFFGGALFHVTNSNGMTIKWTLYSPSGAMYGFVNWASRPEGFADNYAGSTSMDSGVTTRSETRAKDTAAMMTKDVCGTTTNSFSATAQFPAQSGQVASDVSPRYYQAEKIQSDYVTSICNPSSCGSCGCC